LIGVVALIIIYSSKQTFWVNERQGKHIGGREVDWLVVGARVVASDGFFWERLIFGLGGNPFEISFIELIIPLFPFPVVFPPHI